MTERRAGKFFIKSKTIIFGAAVSGLGILEWVNNNVQFTGEHAGQILTGIGVAIGILRAFAKEPVTIKPKDDGKSKEESPTIDLIRESEGQ